MVLVAVIALSAPHVARAETTPGDRLSEVLARAAVARADFSELLALYRAAAIDADEAVAQSLALRTRAEHLRFELDSGRRAFAATVTRAYIDGQAALVEAVLSARNVADLNALMPFAESNLTVQASEARALSKRGDQLQVVLDDMERRQAAALVRERRLRLVASTIAQRLREADAAVASARALVEAERARRARDGLYGSWSSTKKAVNLALYYKRKARGEQMFHEAEPFLGPRPSCDAPKGLRPAGSSVSGKASWYGPGFAGKGTASGAVFIPERYTVAHRTLPFGLFLLIELKGTCVMSLLNDRGPYIDDRVLDLSAGSAQAIGLSGVKYVDAKIYVRE